MKHDSRFISPVFSSTIAILVGHTLGGKSIEMELAMYDNDVKYRYVNSLFLLRG